MSFSYRKLSELTPLENNPRTINEEDMDTLVQSIKSNPEYFEARPIILSNRTGQNVILAGNQRYQAAKILNLKEVPTFLLEGLTEVKEREIVIRDNISNGKWDYDTLANEWNTTELRDWGFELPKDYLFNEDTEPEEDNYIIPTEIKTDIVLGDLFEIGEHRLLCGDSTCIDTVAKLMNGQKADMLFTDPPYNVGFNGRSGKFDVIENDDLKTEDFDKFIEEFAQTVHTLQIPIKYIWCNWKFYGTLQKHFELNACIVWAKNVFGLGRGYRHQHEFCFFEGKLDEGINNESDLWEVKKDSNYMHPTQKPIELSARALSNHKNANNILDLFGGSGSTLVGIHQLKRKGFVMELDPKYCQVIIDRMRKSFPDIEIKKNGKHYTIN